jgi:ADP-ribose pyrophosphatase YjhB (NUDIX family)
MKIKGIDIKILQGPKVRGAVVLDDVFSAGGDIYAYEKDVRSVCARALKKAGAARVPRIDFYCCGRSAGVFPLVATAKIWTQETYRHVKEDAPVFKEIRITLSDAEVFKIFDKTIRGYLTHLLEVLTQGPFVTVDTIIEVKGGVVLIKRSNPPFGWALPGGFVDYGESLEAAAAREALEETGLRVHHLKQMHTYSKPGRDPRFHTVTTVFVAAAQGTPQAASDAREAGVFDARSCMRLHLAFDHREILADYLKSKI